MEAENTKALTVGSLFAGIGGFDLGLERAGFEIRWQVEIEPYAVRVLSKHWPHIPKYGDIRAIDWSTVEPVDVICGGFPCQPFSLIGPCRQADDPRNLWPEMRRCCEAIRPTWLLGENVIGALPYVHAVCKPELEALGYRVRVYRIPACFVGAPHIRQRLWIVAYAESQQAGTSRQSWINGSVGGLSLANVKGFGRQQGHTNGGGNSERKVAEEERTGPTDCVRWPSPPDICGMDVRVSKRMDRIRGLGNSVVPQIVEWIGRQIINVYNQWRK